MMAKYGVGGRVRVQPVAQGRDFLAASRLSLIAGVSWVSRRIWVCGGGCEHFPTRTKVVRSLLVLPVPDMP